MMMLEAPPLRRHIPTTVALWAGQHADLGLAELVGTTLASFEVPFRRHLAPVDASDDALASLLHGAETADSALHIVLDEAGAGLATRIARQATRPVLAVPVAASALTGLEALSATADQPRGLALATLALGKAGAVNAALYAVAILALSDAMLAERLAAYRSQQTAQVLAARLP